MEPNLNQQNANSSSAFLPMLFVSLAMLIFVTWQFTLVWKQQSALKNIQKTRTQLVQNSQKVQNELQGLAVGLIELARAGDPDAVRLVQGYGIAQSQPAAGAPVPAAR